MSECDEWTEEAMLLHRIRPFLLWHRYETENRMVDRVLPDGSHTNREAEKHRRASLLLEDVRDFLERRR